MIEEYDISSFELLTRKWKIYKELGKMEWTFEVGEQSESLKGENDGIKISSNNVIISSPSS